MQLRIFRIILHHILNFFRLRSVDSLLYYDLQLVNNVILMLAKAVTLR